MPKPDGAKSLGTRNMLELIERGNGTEAISASDINLAPARRTGDR